MSETSTPKPKPKPKAKPKAKPDNMHLWNQVCETDPDFTKECGHRGGFTSIDPQYQLQRMTETFGPCGTGWGYGSTTSKTVLDESNVIWEVEVQVWYRDFKGEIRYLGPVDAASKYVSDGRVDTDAPKKAMTDALTKSFSRIGLNADVFLGLFDDPVYMAGLMKKKQGGPATEDQVKKLKGMSDDQPSEWLPNILQYFNADCLEDLAKDQAQMVLDRANEKGTE